MSEYQRRDIASIKNQVQSCLDSCFREKSGSNFEKSHYKKRDFYDEVEQQNEPMFDKYGEELVMHTSANLLNSMLPS